MQVLKISENYNTIILVPKDPPLLHLSLPAQFQMLIRLLLKSLFSICYGYPLHKTLHRDSLLLICFLLSSCWCISTLIQVSNALGSLSVFMAPQGEAKQAESAHTLIIQMPYLFHQDLSLISGHC